MLSIVFSKKEGSDIINSERYSIVSSKLSGTKYRIRLDRAITDNDDWIESTQSTTTTSADGVVDVKLQTTVHKRKLKESEEFNGRFFVKILSNNLTDKYIESREGNMNYQVTGGFRPFWFADTIATDNQDDTTGIINPSSSWIGNSDAQNGATAGVITNIQDGWHNLLDFTTTDPKSGWFIDNMHFAAMQQDKSTGGWFPQFDANNSGRLYYGWGPYGNSSNNTTGNPLPNITHDQFVNGMEGIVVVDPKSGPYKYPRGGTGDGNISGLNIDDYGSRTLLKYRPNSASAVEITDTYEGTKKDKEGKHYFMHLSFSKCGEDLHDNTGWPTTAGTMSNGYLDDPNQLNKNLQGIISDKVKWNKYGGGNYGSINWVVEGDNIHINNLTGGGGGSLVEAFPLETLSGGVRTNEKIRNQWNPGFNNPHAEKIADQLDVGTQFRLKDSSTIYTILKVSKLYIYI